MDPKYPEIDAGVASADRNIFFMTRKYCNSDLTQEQVTARLDAAFAQVMQEIVAEKDQQDGAKKFISREEGRGRA